MERAEIVYKVLHVMNSAGGGAAISTIAVIERLQFEGVDAVAVCHDSGTTEERERLLDATAGRTTFAPLYWWNRKNRTSIWKRPLIEARQQVKTRSGHRSTGLVAEVARREAVDLIHTNTMLTPEGGRAAELIGLPHVWHLRELIGKGNPYVLPLEGKRLGAYLARRCSKLVANSNAAAAAVAPLVGAEVLEVIPNGVDLARFDPALRTAPSGTVIVGMVGNLTSRVKKHHLFIEAAALVDPGLPVRWRIIGHDPPTRPGRPDRYVGSLRDRVHALGLEERFEFAGFNADIPAVMAGLDVIVHPADGESFGRVVIEGMAAGRPVVGVSGGGVGELVADGRTGLLAEPDDVLGLAAAIERLVRAPDLRAALGRAGRSFVEEQHSIDHSALRTLDVYREAMDRPLRRPV